MPAPSSMMGRHTLFLDSSNGNSVEGRADISNGNQSNGNGFQRRISDPTETALRAALVSASSSSESQGYDGVFTSKSVTEIKTMLWEIKDFENIYRNKVERAMNFEFEVGRLGSMERHLPRRSRWKIMFDSDDTGHKPALRVLLQSPENRIIFYRLDAFILDPEKETEFQTQSDTFCEGSSDSKATDNLFVFGMGCYDEHDFLDRVRNYTRGDSLFLKVKMEILEDASVN